MKNIFISLHNPISYLFLLACLGAAFILAHYSFMPKRSCELEIVFNTPVPVDFGIYYDIGEGLSQKHHQMKRIEEVNQKTSVSFCITSYTKLRVIRIDPAMQPIQMEIYAVTLSFSHGSKVNVPFEALQAGDQIRRHSWDNEKLIFESTEWANDPNFFLTDIADRDKISSSKKIVHYSLWMLGGLIFALLLQFFIIFFVRGERLQ